MKHHLRQKSTKYSSSKLQVKDEVSRTCYVCERDYATQPLGNNTWRHDACRPGSYNWRDWYLTTRRQTDAGEFLYATF